MKWRDFLPVAYPRAKAMPEGEQNVVFKANRWVGLRMAYVLYHLRLSANVVSVVRLVLAVIGFYLVSRVGAGGRVAPVVGAVLLAIQIHLDFVDGPLARLQGSMTKLGDRLDALPNEASRMATVVLAGFLTNDATAFCSAVFAAYVLVVFMRELDLRINRTGAWKALAVVYDVLLYVPVMAFVVPLLIGLHGPLGIGVATFARLVVLVYALLAAQWLLLCLMYTDSPRSPLQRVPQL